MHRWSRVALITTVVVALGLVVVPRTYAADAEAEGQFVARINAVRESNGLAPLAVYGELHSVARSWTDQMVANGSISHNPNLAGQVSADWTKLGENVGVGSSVDSLMQAFMNSSQHYKNIVDPAYNYIGVGVSYSDDGRMFTTHDFMALPDAAPAAPAAPPPPRASPSSPRPSRAAPIEEPAPAVPPATPARVRTLLIALRLGPP